MLQGDDVVDVARAWNQLSQFNTVQTEWAIFCSQVIMTMVATKDLQNREIYQT